MFVQFLRSFRESESGGLAGTRTRDQRLKRPLLYRLSYQPTNRPARFHRAGNRTGAENSGQSAAKTNSAANLAQGFSRHAVRSRERSPCQCSRAPRLALNVRVAAVERTAGSARNRTATLAAFPLMALAAGKTVVSPRY